MRRGLAVFLALGLLAGSLGPWSTSAQARYPEWFRSMPSSGQGLWAVGYARGYSALETGMDSAKADAYERLRRDRGMTLRGEKLYESAPGSQTSFEGARFTETGLVDTLRSVRYVDSLNAAGMTLVLAVWIPEDSEGPSRHRAKPRGQGPFSEASPPWVRAEMESGSEVVRAVGRSARYYYLQNSWRRAEERARRRLAFTAATKVRRLEKGTEGWRHDVTSIQTKVRLRRVQTLARWADEERCYVLVEGTVEDVLIE